MENARSSPSRYPAEASFPIKTNFTWVGYQGSQIRACDSVLAERAGNRLEREQQARQTVSASAPLHLASR